LRSVPAAWPLPSSKGWVFQGCQSQQNSRKATHPTCTKRLCAGCVQRTQKTKLRKLKEKQKMKHMKKFLALALVALSIFAVAIPAMAATTKHVNISPDVNMRDRIGGSVIIRVPQGARVDVESTSVNNGVTWAKVKFGNMNGYIMDTYLSTGAGDTYPSNSTQAFSLSTLQVSSKKLYMIKNLQLALNYGGYNAVVHKTL
jgi:uncharacterized protein YraI